MNHNLSHCPFHSQLSNQWITRNRSAHRINLEWNEQRGMLILFETVIFCVPYLTRERLAYQLGWKSESLLLCLYGYISVCDVYSIWFWLKNHPTWYSTVRCCEFFRAMTEISFFSFVAMYACVPGKIVKSKKSF